MKTKSLFIQFVYVTTVEWWLLYWMTERVFKRIAKSWENRPKRTKWNLTRLNIKFWFWIKKKLETQLYKYRMENTWLISSKRWTSFRVIVNCKLNYEQTLWCGSEKCSYNLSICFNIIMYSVQMKVANYIAYSIGHKPSGMMRSL